MEKNDLVLVKKQPDNQFARLEGIIAVVVEVDPECATHVGIEQLELTGHTTGSGTVPVDSLEVINDTAAPQWRAAHAVWKGFQIGADDPAVLSTEQADKIIALVANKYNIDCETLRSILADLEDLGVI